MKTHATERRIEGTRSGRLPRRGWGESGARTLLVGLALTCFAGSPVLGDNITLLLGEPQYCECGWVSVNGFVQSDGTLWGLVWDWGDGTRTTSWFPASHRYESNGAYTVVVTAVGCTNQTDVATVEITNTLEPDCPTEASAQCDSYPCRYLFPYNLHLVAEATSDDPLRIMNQSNEPVGGVTDFTPDDPSLVSVSTDGYVTALRAEAPNEIGTWIHATVDGRQAANACVARVLPENYGVSFLESVGEKTALYYPDVVNGEDLGALVQQYQIATVNEYAYAIEFELVGTRPFDGCRQIFEVDFGVSEQSRVCGISGNPIRLGWNLEGNEWQNCFLVPFLPPRSPQWTVFYHELGHNFTWASPTFAQSLGIPDYSEGLASILSLASIHRVLGNPIQHPVGGSTKQSLQYLYDRDTGQYLQAFQNWLNNGASFAGLNADIVDGIWLHHAGANLDRFAGRFFLPLAPGYMDGLGGALCGVSSNEEKHTFFAALVSAAAGEDLSVTFADTYHYPIDGPLFEATYGSCASLIAGIAAGVVPGQADWPGEPLSVHKAAGGNITLAWDPSCLSSDADYAIYEGTLGQFYSHASRYCGTGGATTQTLAPSPGSAYYLVVPLAATREGSYGVGSSGRERPQGTPPCAIQTIGFCQ